METFELKEWHVLVVFLGMLANMFKHDVKQAMLSYMTHFEQRAMTGKTVQIQSNSGEWENVTIIQYKPVIPFISRGGVEVEHGAIPGKEAVREKFSYTNWAGQRIRFAK